jgi:hypothetical protein
LAWANRVRGDGRDGGIYPITHRCHNREFLLRFARDRDAYREKILRRRYRLIDLDRLCWRLRASDLEDVRKNLEASLADRIAREQMKRGPCWTEILAVGSAGFVEKIQPLILSRRETEIEESDGGLWMLKEREIPYGQKTGSKNAARSLFDVFFCTCYCNAEKCLGDTGYRLNQIDNEPDKILFFADESGSWQVAVDWARVLPVWFKVLSVTAEPEEYAERITTLLSAHYRYGRKEMLVIARGTATADQRKALMKRERA